MSPIRLGSAERLLPRRSESPHARLLGSGRVRWPAKILVCADDSPASSDALFAAKALATRAKANVELVSVLAPRIPPPNVAHRTGSERCESRDRRAAAELIRSVRCQERLCFDGRAVWPVQLEVGNPLHAILESARRSQADLVVLPLGCTDPHLRQRRAATPVCVARYTEVPMLAAARTSTALPQQLVLSIDSSSPPLALVRAALQCIEDAAFVWVLMHAGRMPGRGEGVRRDRTTISRIMTLVRGQASAVSRRIVVRGVYQTGDPGEAVLAAAHEVSADLIAAAVHGAAGAVRAFVPNVAEQLLLGAQCSVLVVPDSWRQ